MDLKWTRLLANITQMRLTRATGINQSRISSIENGDIRATPHERNLIEKILGYPVDWESMGPEPRPNRRTR